MPMDRKSFRLSHLNSVTFFKTIITFIEHLTDESSDALSQILHLILIEKHRHRYAD